MTARSLYFTDPNALELRETAVPEPANGEVRVRTAASAISAGTELLVYRGEVPESMAADESIDALDGDFEYPLQYGYAAVGRVTAVGANVDDAWLDRRVFGFNPHESHFVTTPAELREVSEALSDAEAALLANAEAAVNFLLDGRPAIGERVAVFGQGVVGLLTTALLAELPLETLVTVDGYERRRALSVSLGADAAIDPDDDLDACFDGHEPPCGADLAYELSGEPDALDNAIGVVGTAGQVVIGSWYGTKPVALDLGGEFHRSRIRLQSSQVSTVDPVDRGRWSKDRRLGEACRLLERIDAERLITHRVPIGRADDAYRLLDERPREAVGVLLTY
ncbi:zinc-dependent alcohol dehydrogenase [Halococcus saccharolyticus]|uniref:Putative zinc-binding dehydrogenase n=1 Tax=Halococcus saccharolyticus DSM 5350 TaxID=1227455 RepID=M0MND3_9EURY|nr:zinc-binding alcohol dehydrogenase [Halococcus saccharolyticus]EMA47202.1 putative zinc-binding dehydrogenase [Halococcus saccharolyticus DSM 5350]